MENGLFLPLRVFFTSIFIPYLSVSLALPPQMPDNLQIFLPYLVYLRKTQAIKSNIQVIVQYNLHFSTLLYSNY